MLEDITEMNIEFAPPSAFDRLRKKKARTLMDSINTINSQDVPDMQKSCP